MSTALAFDAPLVPPNRMARLPRYAAPGMAQHIIQRGNNRVAIFAAKSDYRFFLECLARQAGSMDAECTPTFS